MQDNYVGDIGDYGKYGLLRNVTAAGLQLAVNWYRVVLPPSNEQHFVLKETKAEGREIHLLPGASGKIQAL